MLFRSNPETKPTTRMFGRAVQWCYSGRRRFATAAAGALVCLVAYHVVFGANGLTTYAAKRHQTRELAREIDELQAENARLAQHNDRLKTDKTVIEESIRTHLHFAKSNEVIVTVPEKQ